MNALLKLEDGELFSYDSYDRQTILEAEVALLKKNKSIHIGVLGTSYIGDVTPGYAAQQLPEVEAALDNHHKSKT